jgi:asparagine synthase (glutamine-hydrolysing)
MLKAWDLQGDAALASFRGMFAFALYDGRRRPFWLVRDRLGVKPLYVCQSDPNTWVFASEVRALLASGFCARRLSRPSLDAYLALGCAPAPWTMVEGVQSLMPGEAWRFDLHSQGGLPQPERIRYWRLPFVPEKVNGNGKATPRIKHSEALEEIRGVLAQAVKLRMLSDVPVGVFLSGGIDSSSIVASLTSQGHKLRTFSVILGDRMFDESEYSRQVAFRFGTEHAELLLQPRRVLEEFDRALAAYDQPSIDGMNTYFVAELTRQAGVKVALSGLGADELFAGYSYFRYMAQLERPWPRRFARLAYLGLRWLKPRGIRTLKLGAMLENNRSRLEKYAVCRQVMLPDRRKKVFHNGDPGDRVALPAGLAAELDAAVDGLDAVNAHSLLEMSLYLGNMLLRDTDQMSMAHSLEVRGPLLDHVLIETVARLPGALKLETAQFGSKALLVGSLPVELPPSILRRRKMGFVFPWERWLRQELRDRITEVFVDNHLLEAAGLDPAGVQSTWNDFLGHRPGLRYTDVLCLLNLVSWVKHHGLKCDDE